MNPRAGLKRAQKLPLAEPTCHQPHRLDSRTDCNSVHFRLQCQGMPSFTKQGQGFADTASVKGWALQAPAELNLAGSFMWQQIKQWQQRWSPATHRTSASMGTRPLSCFGWCRLHAVPGALGMISSTSKSRAKLEGQGSKHDLT